MPNKKHAIALAKAPAAEAPITLVQASIGTKDLKIDRETRTIRNAAFLTAGRASGHTIGGGDEGIAFEVDATTLRQVAEIIQSKPRGVKVRITHPELAGGLFETPPDDIDYRVARTTGARVVGDQVRGDIVFGKYAETNPRGNMAIYLMDLAEEDPEGIGLSLVLEHRLEAPPDGGDLPVSRIFAIRAIDFVGEPGGNPRGLLSQPRPPAQEGVSSMDPKLLKYLRSIGLKKEATDAEAQGFLAGLKDDQAEVAAALAKPADESKPAAKKDDGAAAVLAKPADDAKPPADVAVAARAAVEAERQRVVAIRAAAKDAGLDDAWVQRMSDAGASADEAKRLAGELKTFAAAHPPVRTAVGADLNRDTLRPAIVDALLLRAGRKVEKPHERAEDFRHLSLLEMGRAFLAAIGVPDVQRIGRSQLAELLLSPRRLAKVYGAEIALAQGTGDFPFITEDAMGKSLRQAYQEQEKSWPLWVRRATAPDYKQIKPVALSEAPDLVAAAAGKGIEYGTLTEAREVYALADYNGGIRLTRVAIVNDDLDAFSRVPTLHAYAAARKEDDVVYAILTGNPDMADTYALFEAAHHANLDGSGSVPWYLAADPNQIDTIVICFLEDAPEPVLRQETDFDTEDVKYAVRHTVCAKAVDHRGLYMNEGETLSVATLGAARAAMRIQKGLKGKARLNLKPKFLIVPAALETLAEQLIGSLVDPAKQNATVNPFANKLTVVAEPRLDD